MFYVSKSPVLIVLVILCCFCGRASCQIEFLLCAGALGQEADGESDTKQDLKTDITK